MRRDTEQAWRLSGQPLPHGRGSETALPSLGALWARQGAGLGSVHKDWREQISWSPGQASRHV